MRVSQQARETRGSLVEMVTVASGRRLGQNTVMAI